MVLLLSGDYSGPAHQFALGFGWYIDYLFIARVCVCAWSRGVHAIVAFLVSNVRWNVPTILCDGVPADV